MKKLVKKMKKIVDLFKNFSLKKPALVLMTMLLILTACGNGGNSKSAAESGTAASNTESGASEDKAGEKLAGDSKRIGILQFANHPSLDNCRQGFLQGLAEAGYKEGKNLEVDYQNAQADTALLSQISQSFISKNYDMIVTIATPAAMGAYNACLNTEIPVIYTAVTDPVAAGLADDKKMPLGNVTGTSDELPVEGQLTLIRELMPDAKKIGIIYTSSEENSHAMIKKYQELVGKYGFELVTREIANTADIPMATDSILEEVDLISNLLDNTVVSSLPTILAKAEKKGIPVFGSEIEQVKMGCLGACGVEYIGLGKQTGKMAFEVLSGNKKASEMPYELLQDENIYINRQVLETLNLKMPEGVEGRAAEIFDKISEPGKN